MMIIDFFIANPKIFPTGMIIMSIFASLVYALGKDKQMAIYWACSAGLIFSITFLGK
jgi:hypothetical protein